jgi:hypothetical protein
VIARWPDRVLLGSKRLRPDSVLARKAGIVRGAAVDGGGKRRELRDSGGSSLRPTPE